MVSETVRVILAFNYEKRGISWRIRVFVCLFLVVGDHHIFTGGASARQRL
jgi:hypothetical protein